MVQYGHKPKDYGEIMQRNYASWSNAAYAKLEGAKAEVTDGRVKPFHKVLANQRAKFIDRLIAEIAIGKDSARAGGWIEEREIFAEFVAEKNT